MAESSLTLTYDNLRAHIGHYLGYGRDDADWSTDQAADIEDALLAGLRRFYMPPPVPNERGGLTMHQWSFLHPQASLVLYPDIAITSGTTVSGGAYAAGVTVLTASAAAFYPAMVGRSIVITGVGTFTITAYTSSTVITVSGDASTASSATFSMESGGYFRLPDTFKGLYGGVFVYRDQSYADIRLTTLALVNRARHFNAGNGIPSMAALLPVAANGTTGQRYDLLLDKSPSSELTIDFEYFINVDALVDTTDYPVGAGFHDETIKASCLAAAEEMFEDGLGPKDVMFKQLLLSSIRQDNSTLAHGVIGYNGNGTSSLPSRHGYDVVVRHENE